MNDTIERVKERCRALGLKPTSRLISVSITHQLLGFYADCALVKSYVVSTSRQPPANVKDSLGTPLGLHEVGEKIGAGQPPGIVYKARVATGRHFSEFPPDEQQRNLITSRILWLRGLEPGVNAGQRPDGTFVDTFDRYVYIHGTNHEHRLGVPFSGGCVEMANLEIIELFEQVRPRDLVWIEE